MVAGIRTPEKLDLSKAEADAGKNVWKMRAGQAICEKLEAHVSSDMVDVEFTVQKGVLYLSCSPAAASAAPAPRSRSRSDLVSGGRHSSGRRR